MDSAEHRVGSRAGGVDWLDRAGVPLHPKSAEEALGALDAVTERLIAEGDARAAFPDVYGIITRRVAESVALGDRGSSTRHGGSRASRADSASATWRRCAGRSTGGAQDAGAWDDRL